jgi:glycosyltransferase involved in cell wall biosynthesis
MAVIAHITSAHPRTDVRIFLKECSYLANRGHAITLLVADGLGNEVRNGVQIESVPKAKGRLGRMGFTPIRLLRKCLHLKANLYHLHDPELIPVGLFLKAWGAKVVFDAHEDLPKQVLNKSYLPSSVRRIVSAFTSAFLRVTLPWFDGLVAATPTIKNLLLSLNANTIDINNYPIRGELLAGDRISPPNRSICYVGAISRIRGLFELVSAMEYLPKDVRLQLAGPFEDSSIEKSIKHMEGWHQVDYLGVLDRDGVRKVMANAMVGIVTLLPAPNYIDSQPIKMFEYMSAGLAVVASDFPLWQNIIREGPCGLCVNPQDPRAIADAVLSLVSQPEVASVMGQHGQKAVLDRYNWEVESIKLCVYYDSLLSR